MNDLILSSDLSRYSNLKNPECPTDLIIPMVTSSPAETTTTLPVTGRPGSIGPMVSLLPSKSATY